MEVDKKFIRLSGLLILSLLFLGIRWSWGDPVSKYRFYDTFRSLKAEEELDWRIRRNKVENLRLEFEATQKKFNSRREDYIDYFDRREKDYRNFLRKEEEVLTAPYLSFEDRRDISKSYQKQNREVTEYYDKLRMDYYDYVRKSAVRRIVGFTVGSVVTFATAGQAAPTLFALQSGKFALDEVISTKFGFEVPGPWRAINFIYDSGFSFYMAHLGFQNAASLANNGQKFLASIEYIQAYYTLFQPVFNEYSKEYPDSFIGRGLPGIMAGINLCSNIANTSNVPEGRYLSKSSWKYPESVFRIGSAVSDIVTIDYAIRGRDSWAARHPESSFYLQQGCRLADAAQTVIATHLGTKEFNKAADLKLVQGYVVANKIGDRPMFKRVGNNEVITESLTCQEVESCYIDSPRKVSPEILQNTYRFAKLRYERAGKFLQEYVSQARVNNPIPAVANPFLFTCEGPSSYSNYEDFSFYLDSICLNNRKETGNYNQNNSHRLANLYAEASTNYIFPGGKFSVSVTNEGITYKDHLNTGIGSEFTLGKFWEYRSGTVWTEKEFELGRPEHSESFSLEWEDKFANADPKAFNLIEGLEVAGSDGEIWEVDMIGGPRNIDGTFYNGKSQGFWSGGLDRHGQILPTGSGLLVDTKHQNYYAQLSKGFAPERSDWAGDFTSYWRGNYLFNQLNQPAKNFFKDFGSPYLEDFTPQTIAQKYDPWLQNYTVYGGGVEQIQDALGKSVTYNRTDKAVEMMAVLGRDRSIEAREFWRVEPGQGVVGNLKTGEVRGYSLSGQGEESLLGGSPTPVEVYTGEWRSKTRERVFEGNQFEAREGFGRSVVNMDRHLNTGMANLVKGVEHREGSWIEKSQESFKELGNDRNGAITQARIEEKILDISEVVIGTRENPRIDLSFYRDSEGKVIGYSYIPHENELQDNRVLIEKKVELLPSEGEVDRLLEGCKGYGGMIEKKGKDLLSYVCALPQAKAMEDVLEGSQRIQTRLEEIGKVEPGIELGPNDFRQTKSDLIAETVKFIVRENKTILHPLISIFSPSSSETGYSLKILIGKDKYQLSGGAVKLSYQWEMAKSFESNPEAKDKFTLKFDTVDKRVTQSWGGQCVKLTFDGARSSLAFPLYEGYFLSGRLDLTAGYGQSKKTEYSDATFLETSHLYTLKPDETVIRAVGLTLFLTYMVAHANIPGAYLILRQAPAYLRLVP